ncbi:MAG: OmpA family protein [Actinomycetaceae bacterium]|nr:OmpA family protein [Actinomycetaceae bacterium]
MTTHPSSLKYSAILIATAFLMGACSSSGVSQESTATSETQIEGSATEDTGNAATSENTESAAPAAGEGAQSTAVPTVAGFAPGEIPPIPLFVIPDMSVISSKDSKFDFGKTEAIATIPGITISPAKCEGNAVISGNTVIGGDGSGNTSQGSETAVNGGDGSGNYSDAATGITIVNGGNGSGNYSNSLTNESMVVGGDGSGNYSNGTTGETYVINGNGSGNYSNSQTGESIVIGDDGTGNYSNAKASISIVNGGNGTGNYTDESTGLTIINNGDGTALVNGVEVKADPLPPVPKLGKVPPIPALAPVEACGTMITLEDGVLFDFGKAEVRPDAQEVVSKLAAVFSDLNVPNATVTGHTDSISDDAFNMTLSEQRAQAVVAALKEKGVPTSLQAEGKGETQPVAPNENADGSDNPGGRQLNRRVEIFVPNF